MVQKISRKVNGYKTAMYVLLRKNKVVNHKMLNEGLVDLYANGRSDARADRAVECQMISEEKSCRWHSKYLETLKDKPRRTQSNERNKCT